MEYTANAMKSNRAGLVQLKKICLITNIKTPHFVQNLACWKKCECESECEKKE